MATTAYFYVGPMVQIPPRNYWVPRMDLVKTTLSLAPGLISDDQWRFTGQNDLRAVPWACGAITVDDVAAAAFVAAVAADGQIYMVTQAKGADRYNTIIATERTKINSFCDAIGVTRPANNEVISDFYQRLVAILDPLTSMDQLAVPR